MINPGIRLRVLDNMVDALMYILNSTILFCNDLGSKKKFLFLVSSGL